MLDEAEDHLAVLRGCLSDLDPATLGPEDAQRVLALAVAIEHLGAGLKLLVSPRVLLGAPWCAEGHRSAASWLAEVTRSSVPQAVATMETAERLAELPATTEALRRGELSPVEAQAISVAATADPTAEEELVQATRSMPLHQFCLWAKRVTRAAQQGDQEYRRRLVAKRFLRFWTDTEGMLRLSGGLLPEDGVELISAVRSRAAHSADEAFAAGLVQEDQAAYDADALVALTTGDLRRATFTGSEGGRRRSSNIVLHVSLEALRRGALEDGECCEVPGVGPVPVQVATGLLGDSLLRMVISDGVAVSTVTHIGRCVPAHVQSALEARDRHCVVPNCRVTLSLETDHWKVPFAEGGPSELWNLARICRSHHRLKTYEGYRLTGGPGKWAWQPPD